MDENNFEWDEVFDYPKDDHDHDDYAASHCIKWALIEDAYVKQWQQCVKFGKWVAANESRFSGWYHSPCTIGPNPKPICIGATLHSLAITRGKLQFYKLYAQTYGGKDDGDLQGRHSHTAGVSKSLLIYLKLC